MPLPKHKKLIGVAIREDQNRKLDVAAKRMRKTRSQIVEDLLDRHFTIVPDAEIPPLGLSRVK